MHLVQKTYLAKEIAKELTDGKWRPNRLCTVSPFLWLYIFVEGLRPLYQMVMELSSLSQKMVFFKKFLPEAKKPQKTEYQDNFEEGSLSEYK